MPMFADSMYLHADTCMYDKWSHAQNRNRSLYLARKSILKEASETLPLVIFSYLVNITACKSLGSLHFASFAVCLLDYNRRIKKGLSNANDSRLV